MNVKVSIVVPFKDNVDYLSDCLNSLQKQTYENIEVIVVDDGSSPKISSYVKNSQYFLDQRFVYLFQKNQGAGVARILD